MLFHLERTDGETFSILVQTFRDSLRYHEVAPVLLIMLGSSRRTSLPSDINNWYRISSFQRTKFRSPDGQVQFQLQQNLTLRTAGLSGFESPKKKPALAAGLSLRGRLFLTAGRWLFTSGLGLCDLDRPSILFYAGGMNEFHLGQDFF